MTAANSEPVVIWGAGAIGSVIGACLVNAGYDTVFVDKNAEHVACIAGGNLQIEGPALQTRVGAPAFVPEELSGRFGTILLAVKSQHTLDAVRMLRPHLADDGVVVSIQNGLNEIQISGELGAERTVGAFVNFPADYTAAGRITFGGTGTLSVGELDGSRSPQVERIAEMLRAFDPATEVSSNIIGLLWSKMAYVGILATASLTNEPTAQFVSIERFQPLVAGVAREILECARRQGISLESFTGFDPEVFIRGDPNEIRAHFQDYARKKKGTAKPHSGIWRDIAIRRRPTEVTYQFAPIFETASRHGHPMPMTRKVIEMISLLERGERHLGIEVADEVLATL